MLAQDQEITVSDRRYVEGVLANRAGAVARSLELLVPLRESGLANPEREATVLQTLGDDYAKIGAYAQSADAYGELLRRFGPSLPERVRKTALEDVAVFDLIRDAPPQTAALNGPQAIPLRTNRLGLQELQIQVGSKEDGWVLDTGANLSTISLSSAQSFGLTLSSKTIQTEGVSGDPVEVHVAVLPELVIEKAIIRNVVVLVAADKDLAAANYKIHGIVGFPVLAALGQLTFSADALRIGEPAAAAAGTSKLFLDEMTPLIAATAGGVAHLFTLDTGAGRTVLSARYARAHAKDFSEATAGTRQLTGVGGSRAIRSYTHVTVRLAIAGMQVTLKDVDVLREAVGTDEDSFYGILGRDALRQFGTYTIDFGRMEFSARP